MPYVRVAVADLVPGQEYVLTHVGCSPKTGSNGATFEQLTTPIYAGSSVMMPYVIETCNRVIYPPGSKTKLANAYYTWKRISFTHPTIGRSTWQRAQHINETDYLKRAFYKGPGPNGHVFVQQRSFGSKKAVAFNPGAEPPMYSAPHVLEGPKLTWAVWTEVGGAAAQEEGGAAAQEEEEEAAEEEAVAAEAVRNNLQMGNLLGLNNKPKMSNGNTAKARENWYKQHAREQELKGLFGGRGRTVRRRRRGSRKGTRRSRRY